MCIKKLMKWSEKKLKKFDMWDISVLKTYCMLIGIVIGAYISDFVKKYVWVFVIVILVLMTRLLKKMFCKKKR